MARAWPTNGHMAPFRLLEKSRVRLLVSSEVGGIDVQSLNRGLAFKSQTLDRGEIGAHLGASILVTFHAGGFSLGARSSSLPLLSWVGDVVLIHGSGNTWGDGSSEYGKSSSSHESLAGLRLSIQHNIALLHGWRRSKSRGGGDGREGGDNGKLHDLRKKSGIW